VVLFKNEKGFPRLLIVPIAGKGPSIPIGEETGSGLLEDLRRLGDEVTGF